MTTLVLQDAVAVLLVVYSLLALLVARRMAGDSRHRAAWLITGVVLGVYSLNNLVQVTFATVAYVVGREHHLYAMYEGFAPIGNHSRTLLVFVLYGALVWLALRGPLTAVRWGVVLGAALLAMLGGALLGWSEGPLDIARHFPATAMLDTIGFVALGSVLLLLMARDTIDRFLWFSLATYGFTSLIGALYLSAMAWFYVPGSWTPPNWQIQLWRAVLALVMVGLAARRLGLARRGRPVRGLLPRSEPIGRPTLA